MGTVKSDIGEHIPVSSVTCKISSTVTDSRLIRNVDSRVTDTICIFYIAALNFQIIISNYSRLMEQEQLQQYNQMVQAVNERFRSKRDLWKYLTKYEVSEIDG